MQDGPRLAPKGRQLVVAGAGIGGLAAALQAARAGWRVCVLERSAAFGEVGAGIQLGPNATRLLAGWGFGKELADVAAFPQRLQVRAADSGRSLSALRLGESMRQRYGATYATLHRHDLHALLLRAVRGEGGCELRLNAHISGVAQGAGAVTVRAGDGTECEADALVGADGLWSAVRRHVDDTGEPTPSGHVAYRAMVAQRALPATLRCQDVTVWLGPNLHAVAYPVRQGELLNVVVIVADGRKRDVRAWDQDAVAGDLQRAARSCCDPLQALLQAGDCWRLWVLNTQPPLRGAGGMARGRIALLGDAAHPMLPYLAQGAGMALEDAAVLGRMLGRVDSGTMAVTGALRAYAAARWQRNARVQRRAERNGTVFHAAGPLRAARDLAMRCAGERLLDVPWLYGYDASLSNQ